MKWKVFSIIFDGPSLKKMKHYFWKGKCDFNETKIAELHNSRISELAITSQFDLTWFYVIIRNSVF